MKEYIGSDEHFQMDNDEVICFFMGGKYNDFECHWEIPNKGNYMVLEYTQSFDWIFDVIRDILKDRPVIIYAQSENEYHCNIGVGFIKSESETLMGAIVSSIIKYIEIKTKP